MGSEASIWWGLLFSSIGLGFSIYGKKQRKVVPLVCGLALMIYPYFIPNATLLAIIGIVLTVIPYFLRL
jgi:predicted membrane protein